ncbi:hypothetical protein FGB62_7g528 [Gracilaria domingensis]|nr:hypothetical protein FGB62_7g528 [Gracilaria domingensis]
MSDQPIRRVLFSCPPRPRRFQNLKTILKPKEELRSFKPVATPTSGTKKRKRTNPFESTPLKDICDSSPVPLPIAAAAAAAAAAKHIKNADRKTAVEEMMKAAGQVLNSRSVEEGEESRGPSTPVRRRSVTFAEPVQVREHHQSFTHEDFNEAELADISGADDERGLKAIGSISATEADATNVAQDEKRSHGRPDSPLMHHLTSPENRQQTENRKVGFEHFAEGSAVSNGRETELERITPLDNKKRCVERSPFSCNEEIKSRLTVFSSDEKVGTKHTTFTNDQERRGSEVFDSQPFGEAESHLPASSHTSRWKATRAQSKLEVKLSSSVGSPKEVDQSAFQEDSVKSLATTESDTSELGSIQSARKRSPRKRRLSEVLKLQKSLETAFWTDSRLVQGQTEAMVISDDEITVIPRGKNSTTPKKEMEIEVKSAGSKERSKTRSKNESESMVSRLLSKHDKRRGIVKSAKNATALQGETSSSLCVASRTRSKSGRATMSRLQQKSQNVPLSFNDRSKSRKSVKKTSGATVGTKKGTELTGIQVGKRGEVLAVKTSKSSKRKSSAPQHLSAQDLAEVPENLSPTLSSEEQDDPLLDLVKVKLSNKMWQAIEDGWAVHNDITSRARRRLGSYGLPAYQGYFESPFFGGPWTSTFGLDLCVGE